MHLMKFQPEMAVPIANKGKTRRHVKGTLMQI